MQSASRAIDERKGEAGRGEFRAPIGYALQRYRSINIICGVSLVVFFWGGEVGCKMRGFIGCLVGCVRYSRWFLTIFVVLYLIL